MSHTQQKYSGVKPVYHDRSNGLTTYERIDKHQTRFDSTAEFKAYIMLEEYFTSGCFTIDPHSTIAIGKSDWKVDFKVTPTKGNDIGSCQLAEIINAIQGTQHAYLPQIFVEYKGFQDKNFIAKMSNIATVTPMFAKTIILVSDYVSAFGCYDRERQRFYCHPILSMPLLKGILENIL
ncbi:hypothetical protein [Nostoc sp.]|uniref:hypothetical protein n=1 Tax=Nostoc sp. TaxID=1180 RepID=UPI002FF05FAD